MGLGAGCGGARIRRTTFLHFPFWFALLAGLLLLAMVETLQDDRVSALAAGLMQLLSVWMCLGLLRLHPLSAVMVYLYVFALFHLGLVVPWALDIHSGVIPHWMQRYSLSPALTLVIVALTAYQVGATLAASRWGRRTELRLRREARYQNAALYHLGLVMLLLGIGLFLWGIGQIGFGRFLEASYMETFELVRLYDPRFFVTSLTFVPVALYVMAASASRRRIVVVLAAGLLWCSLIFFLGFRGFALIPLVVTLAVLNKRGFRLPGAAYIAGLVVLLMAIPIARSMRNNRLLERSMADTVVGIRPLSAVEEMGGSLEPLVHTLWLMENESLRWGKTYWQSLKRVAPNLATDWEGGGYVAVEDIDADALGDTVGGSLEVSALWWCRFLGRGGALYEFRHGGSGGLLLAAGGGAGGGGPL